jgi:dGTPase
MEGKTQVFAAGLCDHFRNRLTHSIEVSQVARTLAVALGLNEEFTETLALAHDLGHPPFGHAGELELNRQMARFGKGFEHNLHSLRIVDVLEERYARFDGLNLTFEVREGILKHSREIPKDVEPELQEFLPGLRPPLEAQLLDLADEIAYNTADLDDAFSAGSFSHRYRLPTDRVFWPACRTSRHPIPRRQ